MTKTEIQIQNGSFSPPFTARPDPAHGGHPAGEVTVAHGWEPYYTPQKPGDPAWKHRRPEWTQYQTWQKVFGTSGTIQGGIFQRVPVQVGDVLTLVVNACFTSDHGGVALRVGLDPFGGTDFQSSEVWWGGWQGETAPKDDPAYWEGGLDNARYLSVENVEVEAPYVTLFLHIENLYAGKDESAFWNQAILYKEGDSPGPDPEPTGDLIEQLERINEKLLLVSEALATIAGRL